ncbi:MAG: hypothetical protein ABI977_34475 [Acidobacteriota bacterium]
MKTSEMGVIDSAVKLGDREFYLDPTGGEKLGDGSMRIRHLTTKEAYKLYGKSELIIRRIGGCLLCQQSQSKTSSLKSISFQPKSAKS